jgi:hypothetical protein
VYDDETYIEKSRQLASLQEEVVITIVTQLKLVVKTWMGVLVNLLGFDFEFVRAIIVKGLKNNP